MPSTSRSWYCANCSGQSVISPLPLRSSRANAANGLPCRVLRRRTVVTVPATTTSWPDELRGPSSASWAVTSSRGRRRRCWNGCSEMYVPEQLLLPAEQLLLAASRAPAARARAAACPPACRTGRTSRSDRSRAAAVSCCASERMRSRPATIAAAVAEASRGRPPCASDSSTRLFMSRGLMRRAKSSMRCGTRRAQSRSAISVSTAPCADVLDLREAEADRARAVRRRASTREVGLASGSRPAAARAMPRRVHSAIAAAMRSCVAVRGHQHGRHVLDGVVRLQVGRLVGDRRRTRTRAPC